MISADELFQAFVHRGINFFTGVPDSLLKDFCAFLTENVEDSRHIIAANEGNAVALAAGYYLGTGSPGLVYLQNSGLGNTLNPLLSLNDLEVFGIPVLLMIGWRGEPGTKDEPQHLKQGRVTTALLETMNIPWISIDSTTINLGSILDELIQKMRTRPGPSALLVRKGTFHSHELQDTVESCLPLQRERVIKQLICHLTDGDCVVATTGMPSRELFEIRRAMGLSTCRDFLVVGSMGHASSLALGLARSQPKRRVICIDGDGSVLMHMGCLAILGQSNQENLIHVVLNNGSHDSVGGQPTCALAVDLSSIAKACGYRDPIVASTESEVEDALNKRLPKAGPSFIEIRVKKGARPNLGRPEMSPVENRDAFMNWIGVTPWK